MPCNVSEAEGLTYGYGMLDITYEDPLIMQKAVDGGPVGVAIAAGQDIFMYYTSGIITDAASCGTEIDHAV